MFTLILSSHSIEADRPDLTFQEFSTVGEVLEAVAELDVLSPDELAALDDELSDGGNGGEVIPVRYQLGDFGVTCGCVVRS